MQLPLLHLDLRPQRSLDVHFRTALDSAWITEA
jgi:hypothetical protein